ncbi:hypothetical protein EDD16DRAFT_1519651 [Pisolithus croceorrhizus]|nr:hypothetical protein EV401DRAFT_1889510 [Pisolithus croceorrhizus]KAI6118929.1 hypothetical protein EDD16DRAFT_1519651 [Pisolithus croceorrhizus]KAI6164006.1 hypothetical protein EDD17DRAFT_1506887 [Pisolithus thermaeus]
MHFSKKYIEKCKELDGQLLMLMMGPGGTGSVATLIDGMTIHKGLGIKIKNQNKARETGSLWKNVEFVLLDEVSLMGLELLADIDHALQFAKAQPDPWFGGVAMIFGGQTEVEIKRRLGRLAWKAVDMVVNLTEQQHMKGDPEYGSAVQ